MAESTANLPKEATSALEQFPEFELSKFNDSGANGYVLIGRHKVLNKDVAIKIYFHDEHEIDQEPALISQINHDNVLKVYDARKVEKDCSYFLMPAASDGDLSNYLNEYHLSLPLAHKLFCQLLSGISALHGAPNLLVHRDVKPENLLIHNDKIVIADFGSVRRIDKKTQQAPASKHSILYRPPEAFGDDAYFDFSSDIYQAGMVGFRLFGGKLSNDLLTHLTKQQRVKLLTIQGDYEQSKHVDSCIEARILQGRLIDWSTIPFFVPGSVKRVLKAATAVIGKRHANVSEVLAKLSGLRGKLPDWIVDERGYQLRDWKKNDYLICENELSVMKRRTGAKDFRTDKSYHGKSLDEIHDELRNRIGLPV
jgi:hypothetical protein